MRVAAVRELRPGHHVAGGEDAPDSGLQGVVDDDVPAVGQLDAGLGEPQAPGGRAAAHGHQQDVGVQGLVAHPDRDPVLRGLGGLDGGAEPHVDPPTFQRTRQDS